MPALSYVLLLFEDLKPSQFILLPAELLLLVPGHWRFFEGFGQLLENGLVFEALGAIYPPVVLGFYSTLLIS